MPNINLYLRVMLMGHKLGIEFIRIYFLLPIKILRNTFMFVCFILFRVGHINTSSIPASLQRFSIDGDLLCHHFIILLTIFKKSHKLVVVAGVGNDGF